jgi:dTDP-4-dehydrorhamnose reductase
VRVGILGARGQLGYALERALAPDHQVHAWGHGELDITDLEALPRAIAAGGLDYVVNAAAYTDVDGCETHRDQAWAVNAQAPGRLAELCAAGKIGLLHFSTDYVFDGTQQRPYRPDDPTDPIQEYGRSKLAGEQAVQAHHPQALIVRTAWLYGAQGRNFVKTILAAAATRPRLEVVDDQRGAPTLADDLAVTSAFLIARGVTGVLHATNTGECTWYQFARRILELRGITTPVVPITSAALTRPARRPAYSVLDAGALRATGAPPMRSWEDALRAFLALD